MFIKFFRFDFVYVKGFIEYVLNLLNVKNVCFKLKLN